MEGPKPSRDRATSSRLISTIHLGRHTQAAHLQGSQKATVLVYGKGLSWFFHVTPKGTWTDELMQGEMDRFTLKPNQPTNKCRTNSSLWTPFIVMLEIFHNKTLRGLNSLQSSGNKWSCGGREEVCEYLLYRCVFERVAGRQLLEPSESFVSHLPFVD